MRWGFTAPSVSSNAASPRRTLALRPVWCWRSSDCPLGDRAPPGRHRAAMRVLRGLGLDELGHDPAMLADLPAPGESPLLVGRQRPVVQERGRYRFGNLGISLH